MSVQAEKRNRVGCHQQDGLRRPLGGQDVWSNPRMWWEWVTGICVGQRFQAIAPKQTALGNEERSEGAGRSWGVKLYKASQAGSGLCLPPYMRRQGLGGDQTSVWKRSPCCYVKSSHRKEPPRDRWQQQSRWERVVSWARILVLKGWEAGGQDMLQKLGQYDALVNWARIRKKGAKGDTRFGPWATGRMELLIPEMGPAGAAVEGRGEWA